MYVVSVGVIISGILSGFLQTWIVCLSVCAMTCRIKQSRMKADRIPDTPAGSGHAAGCTYRDTGVFYLTFWLIFGVQGIVIFTGLNSRIQI
jgi:hypothetical protein